MAGAVVPPPEGTTVARPRELDLSREIHVSATRQVDAACRTDRAVMANTLMFMKETIPRPSATRHERA